MHLGFIMDGNGRWATQKNMLRIEGHKKGAEVANEIMMECVNLNIDYATFYAFSLQNWSRDKNEIEQIFHLAKELFNKMKSWILEKNAKVQCIGSIQYLPEDVKKLIHELEEDTKEAKGTVISVCISYGGREEILEVFRNVKVDLKEITTNHISELFRVPDVDLIIRTSGEFRISNFLLWQSAYAEYYFTNTFWPDFTVNELHQALGNFSKRKRRFGTLPTEETEENKETMLIEYQYEYIKQLYSEHTNYIDLKPIYNQLVLEGHTIPKASADTNERGIVHKFSQATEGATKLGYILDDMVDNLPIEKQNEYLKLLYSDFSVETLELVCRPYLLTSKPESKSKSLFDYFIQTTPKEKELFKKVFECEYLQRTSTVLLDKFIYRIIATFYYTKLTLHDSFISDDKRLLYTIIVCFCDDSIDEENDLPELHYLNPELYPFISSIIYEIWNSSKESIYRKRAVFLAISILLYRIDPQQQPHLPKQIGDCFQYILESFKETI
uniref:Isoprenyl transferase n=1 Tax=viral metagenome TaxID=1070528 RepID=A0A6C0HEH4_9ZZZZ